MKTSIKNYLFPLALSLLSACAANPYRPAPYRSSYIIEQSYYPRPAYNNRRYVIERDYYNFEGTPYNYRPYGGHHRHHEDRD